MTKQKSFREWFAENLSESAEDIADYGAECGFPHITYTEECAELFDRFGRDIWDMAVEEAEAMCEKNVCAMIAGFRRSDMMEDLDQFKNLMVWFACEIAARELITEREDADSQ